MHAAAAADSRRVGDVVPPVLELLASPLELWVGWVSGCGVSGCGVGEGGVVALRMGVRRQEAVQAWGSSHPLTRALVNSTMTGLVELL